MMAFQQPNHNYSLWVCKHLCISNPLILPPSGLRKDNSSEHILEDPERLSGYYSMVLVLSVPITISIYCKPNIPNIHGNTLNLKGPIGGFA